MAFGAPPHIREARELKLQDKVDRFMQAPEELEAYCLEELLRTAMGGYNSEQQGAIIALLEWSQRKNLADRQRD